MALPDKLSSTEWAALPQALKDAGAYKAGPKGDDGAETWVLDSPEAAGLATKLKAKDETIQRLQKDAETSKRQIEELTKRFDGIDPEAARRTAELEAERERGELVKKGDIQGLIEREREKWNAAQAKKMEAVEAEKQALEEDLHQRLVLDTFRSQISAGEYMDGKEKKELPVVLPSYAKAAEALYLSQFKPKVTVDQRNGARERRAVAQVDGFEADMLEHIREWLPTVQDLFCKPPQHEGGNTGKTRPAAGGSSGAVRRIARTDQAAINAGMDDIASGKAIVVDG